MNARTDNDQNGREGLREVRIQHTGKATARQ